MITELTVKKTPHAKSKNLDLFGNQIVKRKMVWCFENDNPDSRLVRRLTHISKIYVREYRQTIGDDSLEMNDVRNYHVDVWAQMTKNYKKCGKFKTNYELRELSNRSNLSDFIEVYND